MCMTSLCLNLASNGLVRRARDVLCYLLSGTRHYTDPKGSLMEGVLVLGSITLGKGMMFDLPRLEEGFQDGLV